MSEFRNVTVVREANIYFGGGVTSRTIIFADGSKKTLGIMHPGEYDFDTSSGERMEILSGELAVRLPESKDWTTVVGGESFSVPARARFSLRVRSLSDYCCSFLP